MQISGKTVVITGGGRGIGRELAKAFAAKGGRIAALDLNQADLDETVAQCKALGVEARGYVANVTDEQAVIAAMDAIVADLGSVDVLINNAGIVKDSLLLKVKDGAITGKMTLEQWQAVININLTGVFLCGREAAERMVKQGRGGVIINISSQMGHVGSPNRTVYCMTKHAVEGLTKAMAVELAPESIRVCSVAPTFVDTPLVRRIIDTPEKEQFVLSSIPAGRLATETDIAAAVLYLASPSAAMVTGTSLVVDGGWTAR